MIKLMSTLIVAAGYLTMPALDKWTATLHPMNQSTLTGTATVESKGTDSVTVTLNLDGAPPSSALQWHLHTGRCSSAGGVVGSESMYPVIRTTDGKSATVTATIAAKPKTGSPYLVQVHGPATAPAPGDNPSMGGQKNVVLACGDLEQSKSDNPTR